MIAALIVLGLLLIAVNRVIAVDRGRHGRFRPHPFHSWRHTSAGCRRRARRRHAFVRDGLAHA